jgi:hypothetical protein
MSMTDVGDSKTFREALEYLIGRIVAEAKREGVTLSEVERKMLYFSETGWSLPNILEVNAEFGRLYDTDEYEAKIARLIQSFLLREKAENEKECRVWIDAEAKLREGDYYMLVMIDAGSEHRGSKSRWLPTWSDHSPKREPGGRLRLWLTALACVVGIFALMAAFNLAFGSGWMRHAWINR